MDKQELHLEEYKLCQDTVKHLESLIWRTSSIIGLGLLGSFIAIATGLGKDSLGIGTLILLAAVVIASCWIWWMMSLKWWDIQHTTIYRMRDLEIELDFYQKRYIDFRDGYMQVPVSFRSDQKEVLQYTHKFAKRGIQKSLKWFPILMTTAWLLFIIIQILRIVKLI